MTTTTAATMLMLMLMLVLMLMMGVLCAVCTFRWALGNAADVGRCRW
jgi:hypothetical protein